MSILKLTFCFLIGLILGVAASVYFLRIHLAERHKKDLKTDIWQKLPASA
jgi:hypothetical protein